MSKNKHLAINMAASIVTYAVSLGISFFISPYIVKNVGVDAYGFIGLANNFISYAGLITVSLNSMASRFVTIKIYEKDENGTNRYFSSVFYANLFLTTVVGVLFIFILIYLEQLINIPERLYFDVKVLFAILFINCLLSIIGTVFKIATFATNKLYLNSLREIESNLLRIAVILGLFFALSPKVSYIGFGSLVAGVYVLICNIFYTKKLLPNMSIKRKFFDIKAIWEIFSSGVWNLVNKLGKLLLSGLDLLITNLFIDPTAMGILSLAKTVPSMISSIIGTMAGIFSPNFTILYAQHKTKELVDAVKQAIKIMGMITNIPIIVLIVCGNKFFSLWQPTLDAGQLQVLSILTCAEFILNGSINCIYNIFAVVNKLKFNSVLICISGAVSTFFVFILLKTTTLGIYAVAGVSTIVAIIGDLFFVIPYAAKCLNIKWHTFYIPALRSVTCVLISCGIGYIIKEHIPLDGWIYLLLLAAIMTAISLIVGLFLILNKNDRKYLFSKVSRMTKI